MTKEVTQKRVYFWNILGNLSSAGISVLLLMIVSRTLNASDADLFSLAYSIGHLWVVIGLFQVRNFQATDVQFTYHFESYLLTRIVTVSCMLVTIVPYLFFIERSSNDYTTVAFIVLVVFYRMWDAIADVFQGYMQQQDRLDLAGKSMFFRYATSVIVWGIVLFLTRSLFSGMISLIAWNGLMVYLFDYLPTRQLTSIHWQNIVKNIYWKDVTSILSACFPLFLNGFILVSIFNEPKLVIEQGIKEGWLEEGMQRDYNILFMPVFFMSLCILVIRPLITQLARLWANNEKNTFKQVIQKIVGILFFTGVLVTTLAYFIGTPILSILFGVSLHNYAVPLSLLVFSGILYAIALFFENVLTIFRKQKYLLAVYVVMLAVSKFILEDFIKKQGIQGASIAFLIVMSFYCISSALISFLFMKKEKKTND